MKAEPSLSFILEELEKLLAIDSPTGYTKAACHFLMEELTSMGYAPQMTQKGGVLCDLGGSRAEDALMLLAHTDTLGGMVAEVKENGRLRIVPLGGLPVQTVESENCLVYTRQGKTVSGTFQLNDPSLHVNGSYRTAERSYDTMEVVLDASAASKKECEALGIEVGDIVCFDPRFRMTETGYIKSRFLDDKLSVAILLGFAKYLKEAAVQPSRKLYLHITVYEEVGHGACGSVPAGVTELLSVDMGCVGGGISCTERQVSICAKDSAGPYNYDMTGRLISLAKENGLDYAVDVYPHYGSDADAALNAGYDVRHALIGAGVYASHGYERSHVDGVKNTFQLIAAYSLSEL